MGSSRIEQLAMQAAARLFLTKLLTRKVQREPWRRKHASKNCRAHYAGFIAGARAVLDEAERILADAEEEAEHLSASLVGERVMVKEIRALFDAQEPNGP